MTKPVFPRSRSPSSSPTRTHDAKQPPNLRVQYPTNVHVDFTQLRANALRRYMAFHGLQEMPGSSREQLAVVVARHFNGACQLTDEKSSIAAFLNYIRGYEESNSDAATEYSVASHGNDRDNYEGVECWYGPGDHGDDEHSDSDENEGDSEEENVGNQDQGPTRKRILPDSSSNRAPHSTKKQKKRKARLYCVCKGTSFGNMIACDNKKCVDRSNWYHMICVGLDGLKEPPETWYCPICQEETQDIVPEHQYRKPVASVTYGDMISHALNVLPNGRGSFKQICDFVEKQYESQLNWKLESDQRKSPVWKSSVRKILFSNMRFRKHPDDKGLFCLAA